MKKVLISLLLGFVLVTNMFIKGDSRKPAVARPARSSSAHPKFSRRSLSSSAMSSSEKRQFNRTCFLQHAVVARRALLLRKRHIQETQTMSKLMDAESHQKS